MKIVLTVGIAILMFGVEYTVVRNPGNDTVVGWTPDSKRLLFTSDRGGKIHTLGVTLSGSLLYRLGAGEVRVLQNVLPALALLQLAASQPSQQSLAQATASIEGVVVILGSNEPIAGVDVELTRVEGTSSSPLAPGAAQAYAQIRIPVYGGNGIGDGATPPAALAPEVQYAKTTGDGKFAFRNLKPGKYRLVAARVGGAFNPAEYGQRDPAGRGLAFPIAEGQEMNNARLEMAPTGAITGRVFDENGEPMGHVKVMALRAQYEEGRRILHGAGSVHSNQRGDYRLFWLPPGRYYVAAIVPDPRLRQNLVSMPLPGRAGSAEEGGAPPVFRRILSTGEVVEETYRLVYYGAVVDPEAAKPIDLRAGETFLADVPVGAGKARAYHIRGVVTIGVTGQPAVGATVRLVQNQRSPRVLILTGIADANGVFDLAGAVPGSYSVFATGNIPAADRGQNATPIGLYQSLEIGNADMDLKLSLDQIPPVSGRVVIEGRPPGGNDPDLAKIRVSLRRDPAVVGTPAALAPVPPNGAVAADGMFELRILGGNGARFRVSVSGIPANTYVKATRMGTMDILADGLLMSGQPENPLEITIGTDAGVVNGVVVNDRQNALPNVVVALVPDAPSLRRRFDLYRSATTDSDGRFQIQTVPPGDYKLFAWEYAEADVWQDAQFLQNYEVFGKPIRIGGGSKQEDIQLAAVPAAR